MWGGGAAPPLLAEPVAGATITPVPFSCLRLVVHTREVGGRTINWGDIAKTSLTADANEALGEAVTRAVAGALQRLTAAFPTLFPAPGEALRRETGRMVGELCADLAGAVGTAASLRGAGDVWVRSVLSEAAVGTVGALEGALAAKLSGAVQGSWEISER